MVERYTAEQRNDTWTVGEHLTSEDGQRVAPRPWRFIDHKATWDEAAARQVAAALNAHPYQADQWEWIES